MMKSVKIGDFEIQNRYLEIPLESILESYILIQQVFIILDVGLSNLEGNYLAKDSFGFWRINFFFPVPDIDSNKINGIAMNSNFQLLLLVYSGGLKVFMKA